MHFLHYVPYEPLICYFMSACAFLMLQFLDLVIFFPFHLDLRLLSDIVQVGSQQLDTLNVVALVELLVD